MREKPIIFSGPMVRAILENRKTQTRRVIKPQPSIQERWTERGWLHDAERSLPSPKYRVQICPFVAGQNLWVRETWTYVTLAENEYDAANPLHRRRDDGCPVLMLYRAHEDAWTFPASWSPSIFMPRWASRITLEVVSVRVERIQDISKADVLAEGIAARDGYSLQGVVAGWHEPFAALWDSINKKRGFGWDTNCWVWVIEFKRINDNG